MGILRRLACAALAVAICAQSAPTLAEPVSMAAMTPGYSYFNRPGADKTAHDTAVADCAIAGLTTVSVDRQINGAGGLPGGLLYGVATAVLQGMLDNAIAAAENRATAAAALENCMVVKGWRVVKLPDAEGKALAALDQPALAAALAPWTGAQSPHGEIVRVWNNDAADSTNIRFTIRPGRTVNGQLSLKAVDKAALGVTGAPSPKPAASKPQKVTLDPKWPTKALKPADLATAPADATIIIADIRNVGMHNGVGLILRRMGDDPSLDPSFIDHSPDVVGLFVGFLVAKKEGNMVMLAVPPGRWRIASMGLMPRLNFCLGAPAFEAKAGEVVYAGSFDLGANALGPDMDLERVKAWLAGLPAAQTVKAASYVNGTKGICGDNGIYALEVPGAPFEPGYAWGSMAALAH